VKGRSEFWESLAAEVTAEFPLAASDWLAHADCVESGFYSVQNRTARRVPANHSMHFFADEPPLTPEEEEAAAAIMAAPAQMELF